MSDCPTGTNVIVGTEGNDTLIGTAGPDCILGLGGDDVIGPSEGGDVLIGGPGNDRMVGGNGVDKLYGEAGDDYLDGGNGDDFIQGGDGNDEIFGERGIDRIEGGDGNDVISAGQGDDVAVGGPGNDVIVGGRGGDSVEGGDGIDACDGTGCESASSTVAMCSPTAPCSAPGSRCVAGACVFCVDHAECNDGNVCTADECRPAAGCFRPPVADGTTCSDGNACTQIDTCQAGACAGTNPVVCVASDQCHVAGTCDPTTGVCSNPAKADSTPCSDGNACTQTDTCQAGACTGASPVVCTASDQCHVAGMCDPTTGVCSNPAKADGAACGDGNACTQTDTCQAGTCTGSNPVMCIAGDQCHVAGVCDPATGACSNPTKADGSSCNDANACTQTDTCQTGVCTGANPVVCSASDQCHVAGVCDPTKGTCSNPAKADGSVCSDGNACTQTDACQAGACAGTNPVVCLAADQCHVAGACNPSTGLCSNPPKADGSTCSDGNACTQTDACQAGTCAGANPVTCPASDQCHDAGTCNPSSGTCSNPAKPDGAGCNDGDACTQTDTCQAGTCSGGSPAPACSCSSTNLALNTAGSGLPSPLESDNGWGGGSYPWQILAGRTSYTDTWAHGLAFTGGNGGWAGQSCGRRQATVDFGAPKTFNRVMAWHHGDEHVPKTYHIEYWNGSAWQSAGGTSALRSDLRDYPANGWGSTPTESIFPAVTASKVRFVIDSNCDITHGWLYALQVFSACTASCAPAPGQLAASWPGDGNANDIVGGRHGTLAGGASFGPGMVNQAFSFNGSSSVDVADDPTWTLGSSDFTIDMWVKLNALSGRDPFIGHVNGGGEQNKWVFWYDSVGHDKMPGVPALRFHVNSPHPSPIPAPHDAVVAPWSPSPGRWYHVAVTRSGSTYALYIDGSQVATDTSTYSIPDPSAPLTIGKAESFRLNGSVDEVDFVKRALSVAEIQAIFQAGAAGKCPACSASGAPTLSSIATYDGGREDRGRSIAVDGAGNAFVLGHSDNVANRDFIVRKYDSAGGLVWSVTFDSGHTDEPSKIALDSAGNVLVSGVTHGPSSDTTVLLKFDGAGVLRWQRGHDSGASEMVSGAVADSAGNIYLAAVRYTGGSGSERYVLKYDAAGNLLWNRSDAFPGRDRNGDIAIDASGNLYINGFLDDQYRTTKYTSEAAVIWNHVHNPGVFDYPSEIAIDAAGNVYTTGLSTDNFNYDEAVILKYSAAGALLWDRRYNSGGFADGRGGIGVDSGGNVWVGIRTFATMADYWTHDRPRDVRLIKYDSAGTLQLELTYDSGQSDAPDALALGPGGSIYIAGYSSNGANNDLRVLKYAPSEGGGGGTCIAPTRPPIAYWTFDNDNAHDSAGTNHGTISGATFAAGKVGRAASFSPGAFMKIPSMNVSSITMEAWVHSSKYGYYTSMVTKSYHPNAWANPWVAWSLWFENNTAQPAFIWGDPVALNYPSCVSPETAPMNQWFHLAATYDGTTVKVFVNGVEKATCAGTGPLASTSGPVYIGKPEHSNHSYQGMIDEVVIYDYAVTPQQIEQHYQRGVAGQGLGPF